MQRFSSIIDRKDIEKIFQVSSLRSAITHSYVIDVHDHLNVIVATDGYQVEALWGASPSSDQISLPTIDYRQAHLKPTFRMAFRTQRCIILSDSYYTWRNKDRKPIRVYQEEGIMLYPAIYFKTNIDGRYGFTILTRQSRKSLREYSDIEPVIFDREAAMRWLDFLPVAQVIKVLHSTQPKPLLNHIVNQKIFVSGFNSKVLHQSEPEQALLF